MLVNELQKVSKIDSRITAVHQELLKLYRERSQLLDPRLGAGELPINTANLPTPPEAWAARQYEDLAAKWQPRGISIPTFDRLKATLLNAHQTLSSVASLRPELAAKLTLVLVPPSKLVPTPTPTTPHGFDFLPEANAISFAKPKSERSWQLLLIFDEPEGVYLGTPQNILDHKRYMIGEYDSRALGIREYAAMINQEVSTLFDETTWTVLYKDPRQKDVLPCVRFDGQNYAIGAETTDSMFGDNRFRPAILIESGKK